MEDDICNQPSQRLYSENLYKNSDKILRKNGLAKSNGEKKIRQVFDVVNFESFRMKALWILQFSPTCNATEIVA